MEEYSGDISGQIKEGGDGLPCAIDIVSIAFRDCFLCNLSCA